MKTKTSHQGWLYAAWILSVLGPIGCAIVAFVFDLVLSPWCWFQKVLLVALGIVMTTGVIRRDDAVVYYALPIAGIGFLIGLYQNLMSSVTCTVAAGACNTLLFSLGSWGITPPMLSLTVYTIINIVLWTYWAKRFSK